MSTVSPREGHAFVQKACQELGYTEQQAADYIAEAEHGDGVAYWEYFQTYDDVKQDVHVYFDNIDA